MPFHAPHACPMPNPTTYDNALYKKALPSSRTTELQAKTVKK